MCRSWHLVTVVVFLFFIIINRSLDNVDFLVIPLVKCLDSLSHCINHLTGNFAAIKVTSCL